MYIISHTIATCSLDLQVWVLQRSISFVFSPTLPLVVGCLKVVPHSQLLSVVLLLSMTTLHGGEEFMKAIGIGDEVCSISLTFGNLNERYVRSLWIPFECYISVPIMKGAGFTHLNLEGITECRIAYNHWRKSAKIGYAWRTFAQSQNLEVGTQIIFEFPNATSIFVLFFIYL